MIRPALLAALAVPLLVTSALAADPPKIELKDGDRIVYLGNTFCERDQSYGYLETLLTIRHPDINFTFRNLGWSGDTVWGDARARFGTRAEGFKHLKDHVLALKPTVVLVAYGLNESFAGEAGLPEFEKGLATLLDTLAETRAQIVLIAPMSIENLGPPLPDPAPRNRDLARYVDVMRSVAGSRHLKLVEPDDFFKRSREQNAQRGLKAREDHLTDDGIHLTEFGHAYLGSLLEHEIFVGPAIGREIHLRDDGTLERTVGLTVNQVHQEGPVLRFEGTGAVLPNPNHPGPVGGPKQAGGVLLSISGLKAGKYLLKVDGVEVAQLDTPDAIAAASIRSGPEVDQANKVRSLINKKNELYFHRWRPQNETYLFGFRKHEQGNNAVEIPQFDPLVAEVEAEINKLKKPVKHTYELIRQEGQK